jgi:hypothetical protein
VSGAFICIQTAAPVRLDVGIRTEKLVATLTVTAITVLCIAVIAELIAATIRTVLCWWHMLYYAVATAWPCATLCTGPVRVVVERTIVTGLSGLH